MNFVLREDWKARPAKSTVRLKTPSQGVYIHHSASEQHQASGVREIQNFHMNVRKWADIAYHYLIDDNGLIYVGRGAMIVGAHVAGKNSSTHGICLLGNFEIREPTQQAIASMFWLVGWGQGKGYWGELLGGHNKAASTECPGNHLSTVLQDVGK